MKLLEQLMEQLFYYHNATDMPLQLLDEEGNVLQSFLPAVSYCEMVQEAAGNHVFCERLHKEGCRQAADLKGAYIFTCPAGLIHFAVPVTVPEEPSYYILSGPVAVEYPDIEVVDNLIQQCGYSLNYRKKLYGALSKVPIVEPIRLQYLSQLLKCLVFNLTKSFLYTRESELAEAEPCSEPDKGKSYQIRTPILENALRYIDTNYKENLRLDEVARYVGLNPSYFSTIFKREIGISFSNYIMKKKIHEACRLLKKSQWSLVDISLELGFDNQSYFSRSFKKYTGMSPNQFRHE